MTMAAGAGRNALRGMAGAIAFSNREEDSHGI